MPSLGQGLTGQGVQDHVNTALVGHSHDTISKAEVTAVENVVLGDTKLLDEQLLLSIGRHSGEDLGTKVVGNVDGSLSDGASTTVDEDRLALLKSGGLEDGVVGGAVGQWQRSGTGKVQTFWDSEHHWCWGSEEVAEGTGAPCQDAVTSFDIGDVGTNSLDNTAGIETKSVLLDLTHGDHDILEVQADSLDLNLNLILTQRLGVGLIINEM